MLTAYHNDPKVKAKYLRRVRAHRAADRLVQRISAEGRGKTFRGCAVGCTLNKYKHAAYETELGVPRVIARLEDAIFEGLPKADAMEWPSAFLEAIPVGADLSMVWPRFALWLLVDEKCGVLRLAKRADAQRAIKDVAALYERWIGGAKPMDEEWRKVGADAAYAAAYAAAAYAAAAAADAYAAAAAAAAYDAAYDAAAAAAAADARTIHWHACRDELLRLLAAAPERAP